MPNTNQNFVVRSAQAFGAGEPTQMASLAELGLRKPIQTYNVLVAAFTASERPTFRDIIARHTTTKYFDSEDMFSWDIASTAAKNIPIIEARGEDGAVCTTGGTYGKGGEHIYLLMGEKYFFNKEIIVGSLNELYQFRIVEEPQEEGSNYLYECELMAGADTGISGEYLQAGERFSYEFLLVEQELSEGAGGIRMQTPSTMYNEFSTRRKSKKFTGRAKAQQALGMTYKTKYRGEDGSVKDMTVGNWFTAEEWKFYKEWMEEGDRLDMFARSNRLANGNYANRGDSGNYIHEGNGIMAQMEYGNTHYYNSFNEDFDLDGLEDAITSICIKGNVPLSQRTFLVSTGHYGMAQAHKAINRLSGGWAVLGISDKVSPVQKVQSNASENAMAWGYQFTELISPNGVHLKFILEPAYDDPVRNKIVGPNGRGVMNSYRYDIFDMGSGMEPNIQLCKVNGFTSKAKYIIGMNNPWGLKDDVISSSEDASSVHIQDIAGVCIMDPSRCLSYIPAQLRA